MSDRKQRKPDEQRKPDQIDQPEPNAEQPEQRKPTFEAESLEPRILLSATWIDADTGDEIDGPTDGNDHFIGSDAADIADGKGGRIPGGRRRP